MLIVGIKCYVNIVDKWFVDIGYFEFKGVLDDKFVGFQFVYVVQFGVEGFVLQFGIGLVCLVVVYDIEDVLLQGMVFFCQEVFFYDG